MYNYNPYGYNQYQPQMAQMERLNQLQQMQQNQQPQQMQQPTQQGNVIIPVGSIEEVKAFNNYFDGLPHYFMDGANNKIYIKQLGVNGMPSISVYSLDNNISKQEEGYCTKEEYNGLKSELDSYKKVLDDLLNKLGGVESE